MAANGAQAGLAPLAVQAAAVTSWPTYHLDPSRSGTDAGSAAIPSVTAHWTSAAVDGDVYAEPLVVGNAVIIATQNDSVYALNATTGALLWPKVSLAAALGDTAVPQSSLGCGNVNPTVGVTGTPVADVTAGILYVVGLVWHAPTTSTIHYELFALNLNSNGAILWHETIAPTPPGGSGLPAFDPLIQGQRAALSLNAGNVYIPFGGRWGDCGDYRGWVVGAPASGPPAAPFSWELPSANAGGGIWATSGAAIDGSGNLYVATGNTFSSSTFDYGESVIRLPSNLSALGDYFAPPNWSALDNQDVDLGSVGPALLGNGLLFQVGKEGVGYLLSTSSLGGTNHSTARFSARVCSATNDAAFGGTAYAAPYLYIPCSDGLVAAIVNTGTSPSFTTAWHGPAVNYATSPIVADGLVWTIDIDATLTAFDPATGWQRFTANLSNAAHFATPAAAGGQVFVATGNTVHAFGGPLATPNTFYFAEGNTLSGFNEVLTLFMPNQSGSATINYVTDLGPSTRTVALTAGQVTQRSVVADVGSGREVSAQVILPGPGVVERTLNFTVPPWHGSTDKVGVNAASTEWNFAEGSTLTPYSEYLTLQNPTGSAASVDLHYFTDSGARPVKSLALPANSRRTVEVMSGNLSNNASCTPGAGGTCGVGRGITGVSVSVVSDVPIVAERPFYVNGFSFGSGTIADGHVAFGANEPALTWNFAEGNTIAGFNEYLTLQNPNAAATTVDLHYFTDTGSQPVKTLVLPPGSRTTVQVLNGNLASNGACNPASSCGVGSGVIGLSLQVTSRSLPIVAERPMYMVHDFGSGSVAGAHDVVGVNTVGQLFGFAAADTLSGDNDYLTIQNPGTTVATVTITYYAATQTTRTFTIPASSRHTVLMFSAVNPGTGQTDGLGPNQGPFGVVVSSNQGILVEKPTYGSNPATYGATDTTGSSPSAF